MPDGGTGTDFTTSAIGLAPQDFEFGITGRGQPGHWITVNDATASSDGAAVEQSANDPTEDRLVFAVYRPPSRQDFRANVQLKVARGTMPSTGIAFGFLRREKFICAERDAPERRVGVWRVVDRKKAEFDRGGSAHAQHHRVAGIRKTLKATEMRRFRRSDRFALLPRMTGSGAPLRCLEWRLL